MSTFQATNSPECDTGIPTSTTEPPHSTVFPSLLGPVTPDQPAAPLSARSLREARTSLQPSQFRSWRPASPNAERPRGTPATPA